MSKIEFFLEGKLLGEHVLNHGSFSTDRQQCARNLDIDKYDRFVIDDGRLDSDIFIKNNKGNEIGQYMIEEINLYKK